MFTPMHNEKVNKNNGKRILVKPEYVAINWQANGRLLGVTFSSTNFGKFGNYSVFIGLQFVHKMWYGANYNPTNFQFDMIVHYWVTVPVSYHAKSGSYTSNGVSLSKGKVKKLTH